MNSLNQVQLIWNVTADPEIKQTPNGQTVANFSVATNREWKDSNGEKQSVAEFHNIVIWWKLAEIVEQYLTKWKKVYLQGRLSTRSWEGDDGVKRYKTEVVCDSMIMLNGWTAAAHDDEDDFPEEKPAAKKKAKPRQEEEISIEDIPF